MPPGRRFGARDVFMICRQCGTEIADNALICYRCGAPTTERQFEPPVAKRGISWSVIVVIVILLLAIVAGLVVYWQHRDAPQRDSVIIPLPHYPITTSPHYPITPFPHA